MRNPVAKTILVLVAAIFVSQASYAADAWCQNAHLQEGGYDFQRQGRNGGHKGLAEIMHQLNLTEEQKEQLKTRREKHQEQIQQMQRYLKQHRQRLKEELESPDADKNRINNIITEMKEIEGRLMYLRTVGILETKEILTPEQFEKLQSFHRKTMQKRSGLRPQFQQQQQQEQEGQ